MSPMGENLATHGMISGFTAIIGLWGWLLVVTLHALFRAVAKPDPDPIRPSGPLA